MDVKKHFKHAFTLRNLILEIRPDHFNFGEAYFKAFRIIIREKMTIHIFTLCVATIITCNDSVWINNWCNPELKHVSHLMTNDFPRNEKVDKTMNDKGRMSFTTMLSSNYNNNRLLFGSRTTFAFIGYFYYWYVKVSI